MERFSLKKNPIESVDKENGLFKVLCLTNNNYNKLLLGDLTPVFLQQLCISKVGNYR